MAKIRVLVFGSTGTGKTSLCNTLSSIHMPVADSARGVTFKSYTYPEFAYTNQKIVLTDTIGLDESQKGSVGAAQSIQELTKLLKESESGYNLLIHVATKGRISKSHSDNYELFVDTLAQKKIPTILVITGCENNDPMSSWVSQNRHFFDQDGYQYRDIVATCFASGGPLESHFAPLREASKGHVLDAIRAHASGSSILIYENDRGLLSTLNRVWSWFCDKVGKPQWKIRVNENVFKLLIRLGVPEAAARLLAKGIKLL